MKLRLTSFQKKLCNILQTGLPICWQPFAEIAKALNSNEAEVLQQVRHLKKSGVIHRISALINYRALGFTSTLVAARVPHENLQEVVDTINRLEVVSHNYLRSHNYNLWFTLHAKSKAEINTTLIDLYLRFGIDFNSLPVKRIFKLDVRFDAEGKNEDLLKDIKETPISHPPKVAWISPKGWPNPRTGFAGKLNKNQKTILSKLQDELEVVAEPFDYLLANGARKNDILKTIKELIKKGIIRRIAAIVDYRKLGFLANVLFACEVPQSTITNAGKRLARLKIVSHCYERETFPGWPYNLFAMMHGRSMGQIQNVIEKFTQALSIKSFQLLPTKNELKKQPVKPKLL